MSKAMSLKAKIRNIAKQKNIPAQVILQNYMFERLLVRLSASEYKEKFVLKGGMLVAAIVGLDNRATMDMDTTLKNLPLTPEAIRSALEDICSIAFDDGVVYEIGTISPIRKDDIYGGYRVMLNARFDIMLTPLSFAIFREKASSLEPISSVIITLGDIERISIRRPSFLGQLSKTSLLFPTLRWLIPFTCAAISPLSSTIPTL